VENLAAGYDSLTVIRGINLNVPKGKIVALVGSNGAGKSTTLKTIMGVIKPRSGRLIFEDEDITGLPPYMRVAKGISLVPEGRQLFSTLTVKENLLLGAYLYKGDVQELLDEVYELFPILKERENQLAGTLSGGEQQMLAIARGLMSRPRLLMLDEPSLGLAPLIVEKLYEAIKEINRRGVSILLVEQHVELSLEVADYAYVMEMGEITVEGESKRLLKDEKVRRAYLG